MWFHQWGGLRKNLAGLSFPALPLSHLIFLHLSSILTGVLWLFLFLLIFLSFHFFLHSLLSHLSHSPCMTGRDWTSSAQSSARRTGRRAPAWRSRVEAGRLGLVILWRTCDIEVIFVVILWICDCDLCDDSCKYMIVNRVVIFWDESTKSYCNLLMRYMWRRKEKKKGMEGG
jgi:hypothetical protein